MSKEQKSLFWTFGIIVTVLLTVGGWAFGMIQKASAEDIERFDKRLLIVEANHADIPVIKNELKHINEKIDRLMEVLK